MGGAATKERRRSERLPCQLAVLLRSRRGELSRVSTADISRHGIFVDTDNKVAERELVQLAIELPGDHGVIDVMAMVVRSRGGAPLALPSIAELDLGRESIDELDVVLEAEADLAPDDERVVVEDSPGMGLSFFALSRQAKDRWDKFVLGLARGELSADEPPSGILPVRRRHTRHRSCFLVRLGDRPRMREFFTRDISAGGMFFHTPAPDRVGPEVELVLVHPETRDEFPLFGAVTRIVESERVAERGVAVAFRRLTAREETKLLTFIETGVNYLDRTGDHVSIDQLAAAGAIENQSPWPLVALGQALLREVETVPAIAVLERAIKLDPACAAAHRALSKAYTMLGDDARARQHDEAARAASAGRDE
ncbi:MAG: PilZ domain-containing protein [Myxococcales bacterium]|nr:PilZ domain-containing protein [Myxococcales bacterium]